jgi:hypothetical protein
MNHDIAHEMECASAAYAALIERAALTGDRRRAAELRREWRGWSKKMNDNWPDGPKCTDICIDCDGAKKYPSGADCISCAGTGRVFEGDGIKPDMVLLPPQESRHD